VLTLGDHAYCLAADDDVDEIRCRLGRRNDIVADTPSLQPEVVYLNNSLLAYI
jgi:hypothetical protein